MKQIDSQPKTRARFGFAGTASRLVLLAGLLLLLGLGLRYADLAFWLGPQRIALLL